MRVRVQIREVDTGKVAIDEQEWDYGWTPDEIRQGVIFQWGTGNYACDCNRELFFKRAIGAPEPKSEELECGDQRYDVDWVEIDGERVQLYESAAYS